MRGNLLVIDVLRKVSKGSLSVKKASKILEGFPSTDIGIANIDCSRYSRCGFPEVVYCQGKTPDQIKRISKVMLRRNDTLLLTRLREPVFRSIKRHLPKLKYDKLGRIAYYAKHVKCNGKKAVSIVTAGTSDLGVAMEAKITLEVMGNPVNLFCDVGVAGMHRLFSVINDIDKSNVIIAIAGMEGALASVISGLVSKPIIAVPTSSGYGANFNGLAPLLTMLNSCAPGIAVVNIDNGFGAAEVAHLINRL